MGRGDSGFLTPTIQRLVRAEVLDDGRDRGKLFGRPRIFNDLLSSQPLCFNAFGELAADLGLAGRVGSQLWPDLVDRVERIEFEWSPGRRDTAFLNNRSAFDVAWFCRDARGDRTFIGIEVKYHENMRVGAARHQRLYDDLAASSGMFVTDARESLRQPPLQQLWLDHLLALALARTDPELHAVRFVLCAPDANTACSTVAARYRSTLGDPTTFGLLSLARLIDALHHAGRTSGGRAPPALPAADPPGLPARPLGNNSQRPVRVGRRSTDARAPDTAKWSSAGRIASEHRASQTKPDRRPPDGGVDQAVSGAQRLRVGPRRTAPDPVALDANGLPRRFDVAAGSGAAPHDASRAGLGHRRRPNPTTRRPIAVLTRRYRVRDDHA